MARLIDRRRVIELRKQGKTYSDIKIETGISKSTLSGWLKDYPLSENQLILLSEKIENRRSVAVEKCRETKRWKREIRLTSILEEEKVKLLPLSEREMYFAGLFLYWGEGNKRIQGQVSLNNTDPKVLRFYLKWLIDSLKVDKEKIKVCLHLYRDMEVEREMNFWVNVLGIPKNQFLKPYIKDSNRTGLDQKGFGHGTCGLMVNNVRLKERIIQGIEALSV